MRALGRLQIDDREEADRRERRDDGDNGLTGDLVPHGIARAFAGLQRHVDVGKKEDGDANEQEDDQIHVRRVSRQNSTLPLRRER